jgi:Ala-tRNA(Pro) deacylase
MTDQTPANPPSAARAALFKRLDELGIAVRTIEHPAVHTVAESAEIERALPGGHTKNLLLKDDKGTVILVVALTTTKIDLKALPKMLGCGRLSFAKPELMAELLAVTPGSVTAFAVMNDTARRVNVVIDAALMAHDTVNCHPLENTATTNIARDDLLRFIRASGHEPRIAKVEASASA